MVQQEKIDESFADLAKLIRVASEQLNQDATHEGLTNCNTLAEAREAWSYLLKLHLKENNEHQ